MDQPTQELHLGNRVSAASVHRGSRGKTCRSFVLLAPGAAGGTMRARFDQHAIQRLAQLRRLPARK